MARAHLHALNHSVVGPDEDRNAPLGYGTMQLTGDGVWGPPRDWKAAVQLLRLAYDLGVRLFDTAWYYGPGVTNRLLRQALKPYPDDLIVVTKAGNSRGPNKRWVPALAPRDLRTACERDLRELGVDVLPLVLLRWKLYRGDELAFAAALETMLAMQRTGMVASLGVSNVERRHLVIAMRCTSVRAVSNAFSINNRRDSDIVQQCRDSRILYLAYHPLGAGSVLRHPALQHAAHALGITPAQVAIAWLQMQSPQMVVLPGTQDARHLRENVLAQRTMVPPEILETIEAEVSGVVAD